MADSVNAVRESVQQEAADELVGIEGHLSGSAAVAIVAPAEGHPFIMHADQAGVGDGYTMGVAAEVGQHLFGSAEGRLGIDDPVATTGCRPKSVEGFRIGQFGEITEELQLSGFEGGVQRVQKQPPEHARQHVYRQKEVRAASDPAVAVH